METAMKKILICTRKNKGADEVDLEHTSAALYKAVGAGKAQVVRDEQLPWRDLTAIHGNFNGAARAVGMGYDVIVLVEAEVSPGLRTIGKGQYAIAQAALDAGRTVAVARPGETRGFTVALATVRGLTVRDTSDWKLGYAQVQL
jgi:hypothetical protein